MSYDRLTNLVDRILDEHHLNPRIEQVDGFWSGLQGTCGLRSGGELTASRVSRSGDTIRSLTYTDGGDRSTLATDSRTGDFGANVGHDAWGDDGEEFLGWVEGLR